MQIPEWFKKTQPYSQGQIKHFMIAIMNLREADLNIRLEGEKYIQTEVEKQIKAGANYIAISSFIWDNPKLKPETAIRKFK